MKQLCSADSGGRFGHPSRGPEDKRPGRVHHGGGGHRVRELEDALPEALPSPALRQHRQNPGRRLLRRHTHDHRTQEGQWYTRKSCPVE